MVDQKLKSIGAITHPCHTPALTVKERPTTPSTRTTASVPVCTSSSKLDHVQVHSIQLEHCGSYQHTHSPDCLLFTLAFPDAITSASSSAKGLPWCGGDFNYRVGSGGSDMACALGLAVLGPAFVAWQPKNALLVAFKLEARAGCPRAGAASVTAALEEGGLAVEVRVVGRCCVCGGGMLLRCVSLGVGVCVCGMLLRCVLLGVGVCVGCC
eukprot:360101-Chlamydomonas_euryale.AAC.1